MHDHFFPYIVILTGDVSFYQINQYSFSPGPHFLTIIFNVTSGREGEYVFNFTGEIRPRKLQLQT